MNDRRYTATSLLLAVLGKIRLGADREVDGMGRVRGCSFALEVTIAALPSEEGADLIRRRPTRP